MYIQIYLPCMPHAPTHLIHLHLIILTIFGKEYISQIPSYDAIVYIFLLLPLSYVQIFHQYSFFNTLHYLYCKQWTTNSYWHCSLGHQKDNASIHPSIQWHYAHQNVLFCAVSCQLWHRRNLAAHCFTPSSHLQLGLPTGRLPVNSAFTALMGIWLWVSLCTCLIHCSL